jgi:hypothetical protein
MKRLMPALGGAVLLSILTMPAMAAPGSAVSGLAGEARGGSLVEPTVFTCSWYRGKRRCRWVQGLPRPEAYRTGTPEWWRAMEDWGRTGGFRR